MASTTYSNKALTSPSIPTTPTSADKTIVFQENFDDGAPIEFKYKVGLWEVVSNADGNRALDINSMDSSIEYPVIEFGKPEWKDFIFESRVNIVDYSVKNDAPLASIRFRGIYKIAFTPYWKSVELVLDPPWKSVSERTIEIRRNTWYSVRIEVADSTVNVFLDDKLTLSETISSEVAGMFGFSTWHNAHVQFDDITIRATHP
ncbi:MAG: DUF1080 domain-containing protein [Anaerolineales bacterium]|nr:DUF1080 domain-containing protein [Anaerolineales bacterium]